MCQFVMRMTIPCDDKVRTMSVMDMTLLEADFCRTDLMEVGFDHIADGDVCKLAHSSEGKASHRAAIFAGATQYRLSHTPCRNPSSVCVYVYTAESNFAFWRRGVVAPYLAHSVVYSAVYKHIEDVLGSP